MTWSSGTLALAVLLRMLTTRTASRIARPDAVWSTWLVVLSCSHQNSPCSVACLLLLCAKWRWLLLTNCIIMSWLPTTSIHVVLNLHLSRIAL